MKQPALILFALAVLAVLFGGRGPASAPAVTPPTNAAVPVSRVQVVTPERLAGDPMTIVRDGTGQFHLDARVNDNTVRFLVDTGADTVALTEADAARAGIDPAPGDFAPIVRTASGEGLGAPVRLERLVIGEAELSGIDAVVVKQLDVSLLGQSVLRRIGRVELSGDRMVIEPER